MPFSSEPSLFTKIQNPKTTYVKSCFPILVCHVGLFIFKLFKFTKNTELHMEQQVETT